MKTNAPTLKVGQWKNRAAEKCVVAYPRHHDVSGRFMACFDALRQYDFKHHQRIATGGGHIPVQTSIVSQARNEIVRAFLEKHDADWLWFIDTDMTFDPDVLDRLVEAAHPEHRPIMGALCFSLQDGYMACPTLYVPREDGKVGRVMDYPPDTKMRVWTGTGCLLIHRSALLKMRDARTDTGAFKFPRPWEWFHNMQLGDLPVGEDITFCIRAEGLGIPVMVDTAIKCGHEKPFIVDEAMYMAQRAAGVRDTADLVYPTFVVIAAKDRHDMTRTLLSQLDKNAFVHLFDNGSDPPLDVAAEGTAGTWTHDAEGWQLHRMWNAGLDAAAEHAKNKGFDKWNVAILNNDIEVPPGFLAGLEGGLRADDNNWVSYPNYHGAEIPAGKAVATQGQGGDGRTLSGWAFMLRGESGLRFDEQFAWWYGDSDIQKQVEAAGKYVVCVGGVHCNHLHPNESTMNDPVRIAQALEDEKKFAAKWGLDVNTLGLTKHGVTA